MGADERRLAQGARPGGTATERATDFTRRALIEAGWTVPVVLAATLPRHGFAASSGSGHNDVPHQDHSDGSIHLDSHGDHTDHTDTTHSDHSDSALASTHADHVDSQHSDHADGSHSDHCDKPPSTSGNHQDHVDTCGSATANHHDHCDLPNSNFHGDGLHRDSILACSGGGTEHGDHCDFGVGEHTDGSHIDHLAWPCPGGGTVGHGDHCDRGSAPTINFHQDITRLCSGGGSDHRDHCDLGPVHNDNGHVDQTVLCHTDAGTNHLDHDDHADVTHRDFGGHFDVHLDGIPHIDGHAHGDF